MADTGPGIAPEVMEHLFEPFFTTKERGKGTGLGLATVHGIVHQSGGHIRVESGPGQGTRFAILLPRAAEGAEASPLRPTLPGRRSRRGSEVVLLVEDEDNIREPAVEILESRGYQVLSAPDATQALTLSDEHPGPIHILVTDVVMPGLSGSQLAGQLLRRRPGAAGALHLRLPGGLHRPPRRAQRGPALPPEALSPRAVPGEDPRGAGRADGVGSTAGPPARGMQ